MEWSQSLAYLKPGTMNLSKLISFCFAALLLPIFAFSQERDGFQEVGQFGITDANLIESFMPVVQGVAKSELLGIDEQSVKSYMMPVREVDQNGTDFSYAIASCLEFYVNLEKNYKVNLSPDYIDLNLKARNNGWKLQQAFEFLASEGTVSAAIMPYGARSIPSSVYATPKYRIQNYFHVFQPETRDRQKLFELKRALMKGNPVLVELETDESLSNARGVFSWKARTGTQTYPLILVGYDEHKEAFELMSTWGASWGRDGYLWIAYDDLARVAQNAFVLMP